MVRWRFPRLRFSLLTLLLSVLLGSACFGLWWRWEPWVLRLNISESGTDLFQFLGWTADQRAVATYCSHCSGPDHLCLWSAETGERLVEQKCQLSEFASAHLVRDGRWLIWNPGYPDDAPHLIWDVANVVENRSLCRVDLSERCRLLADSPDNRFVVARSAEGIFLEDLESPGGRVLLREKTDARLRCVQFSSDTRWLLLTTDRAYLWDLQTRRLQRTFPTGQTASFCPDPQCLLVEDEGKKELAICRADDERVRMPLQHWGVADASPTSRYLLVRNKEKKETAVYSPGDGRFRFMIQDEGEHLLSFDKDDRRVAAVREGRVRVYDTANGQEIFTANVGDMISRGPLLNDDGDRLVYDCVWDLNSGRELTRFDKLAGIQANIRDSRMAYTKECFCSPIYIANIRTGQDLCAISASAEHFSDVFFRSPDQLVVRTTEGLYLYDRRRPEWWWGIAWLPEFWVAYFSGGALLVIAARQLRRRFAKPVVAPQ